MGSRCVAEYSKPLFFGVVFHWWSDTGGVSGPVQTKPLVHTYMHNSPFTHKLNWDYTSPRQTVQGLKTFQSGGKKESRNSKRSYKAKKRSPVSEYNADCYQQAVTEKTEQSVSPQPLHLHRPFLQLFPAKFLGICSKVFPDTIWHCCCLQLYPNLSTGDDQMCPATLHWLLLSHPGSAAPHPSQSGNQGTSYQEQPLFKQQQLGRNIPCFDKSRLRTC